MTEGDIIRNYLDLHHGGVTAFAEKAKKSRGYFYSNFLHNPLKQEFLEFLVSKKVDVKKALKDRITPAGLLEIPVVLGKERSAYIQLPENYTKKELEKIARVLMAY